MKRASFGALAMAALSLAGCETMTPQQCAVADWRALGHQDGAAGYALDHFSRRAESCAKAGYAADFESYRSGREQGLVAYCTPENGFRSALQGEFYRGVCPPASDAAFRVAFADGARAHEAVSAVRSAETALQTLRHRRDEIDRKASTNESGLLNAGTDAERQRFRDELIRLREERARVDGDLRAKEAELRLRSDEVARLRAQIGLRWGPW